MKTPSRLIFALFTLVPACAVESESDAGASIYADAYFEVRDDRLSSPAAAPEVAHVVPTDDEVLDGPDPFIRDCNICVLTEDGAVCTAVACDEIDDREAPACGERNLGDIWAEGCNLCNCTDAGSMCTMQACGAWMN